jgi:Flp pilus assembly protein CpaB
MTKNINQRKSSRMRRLIAAGVTLAVAVTGAYWAIESQSITQKFVVAKRDLPAGSPISAADFDVVDLNLGATGQQYLRSDSSIESVYTLTPLRKGQLISYSGLASVVVDERVPIVIASSMGLAEGIVAGASVDLWVTPIDDEKNYGTPVTVVTSAEVARISATNELFADSKSSVELWVPIGAVGTVLTSIARGDTLSVILRPTLADE